MAQFTTQARPYAKAAFNAAVESDSFGAWSKGLGLLTAVMQHEKVAGFLSNPSLSGEQLATTFLELCSGELEEGQQNLVHLLAANRRLALLPEIRVLFEALKADRERVIEVSVVSAFELEADAETKLVEALKARLQREVKVSTSVDKHLIGGVIVRTGDLVIDGSVRGKLKKLTETMNA